MKPTLLALFACDFDTDTQFNVLAVLFTIAVFLGLRRLIRWDFQQQAKREALMRNGVRVHGTLESFAVTASSPGGKVPSSFVIFRVHCDLGEGPKTTSFKEQIPTYALAKLTEGMAIEVVHPPDRPQDAIVDTRPFGRINP